MKSNLLTMLVVFSVGSVVLTIAYVIAHQQTLPLREPHRMPPSSPTENRVAGAGIVEAASRNINIGAFTAGIVAEVPVTPGQIVKKGDILFRLDSRQAASGIAYQQAVLKVSLQQLAEQRSLPRPEDIPIAEAAVNSADAAAKQASENLDRSRKLSLGSSISAQDLAAAVETDLVARANHASAQASLDKLRAGAWAADLAITEAQVVQAEAALEQAKTTLALQSVLAPSDGEVLQVNVRTGEYVSGNSAVGLIIFGDTSRLHVRVDIDEVDIPRFHNAKNATAFRRGDAKTAIPLTLVRVEPLVIPKQTLTGESQERIDTRVLQVVFAVETGDRSPVLFVGQQLDVFASTVE